jgi:hypothetical protein
MKQRSDIDWPLHIILSVLTAGLWLFVLLYLVVTRPKPRRPNLPVPANTPEFRQRHAERAAELDQQMLDIQARRTEAQAKRDELNARIVERERQQQDHA